MLNIVKLQFKLPCNNHVSCLSLISVPRNLQKNITIYVDTNNEVHSVKCSSADHSHNKDLLLQKALLW